MAASSRPEGVSKVQANEINGPYAFKILSLDGGGIRGAFTAAFLADLEQRLGCRIADYFDIIAGTSTGAIIAAGLALRVPAARIEQFYRERGPKIFQRWWEKPLPWYWRPWRWARRLPVSLFNGLVLNRFGVDHDWLWGAKYRTDELREALTEVFGERRIGDVQGCRLLIPTADLTQGQTWMWKTPHLDGMVRDRHFCIVDALLSTTAAPTYFPHAVIGKGSAYVDGGVWANNPSMVAVAEAVRISKDCRRDGDPRFDLHHVHLLSVGTGKAPLYAEPPASGAGILWWGQKLINLVMSTQAQGIHYQTEYILGENYQRVDYDLPNGTWSLDSVGVIDQLLHFGHAKAAEIIMTLQQTFFAQRAVPYQPYPDITPVKPVIAS
jgi:hypothetical protein